MDDLARLKLLSKTLESRSRSAGSDLFKLSYEIESIVNSIGYVSDKLIGDYDELWTAIEVIGVFNFDNGTEPSKEEIDELRCLVDRLKLSVDAEIVAQGK